MKRILKGCVCILIISVMVPITGAINRDTTEGELTDHIISDFWFLSHVVVRGDEGSCLIVGSHFIQGLGRCNVLIADVEDASGYIKITPLSGANDGIEIEGCNKVVMFGFFGFQNTRNGLYVNGIALIASI